MRILKKILGAFLILMLLAVLAGGGWAWRRSRTIEKSELAELFRAGKVNLIPLDGEFRGEFEGGMGNWNGKSFNLASRSGSNRWSKDGVSQAGQPFKFEVAKSLSDSGREVIRINYNQPEDSWWVKMISEEIVEVAPNSYVGKMYFNPAGGAALGIGYFTLDRN